MYNLTPNSDLAAEHPIFTDRYLRPAGRFFYQSSIEAIKMMLAAVVLDFMATNALYGTKLAPRRVWQIAVRDPFIEEIGFRGLVQSGIGLIQEGVSRYVIQRELTPREKELQKLVRIHLTAFIFAAAHFNVNYSITNFRIKNLVYCYVSSVVYSHLKENHKTLSLPYLFHGTGNVIALYFSIAPTLTSKRICEGAVYANLACALALANSEWLHACVRDAWHHIYPIHS
ncbi:MAG: CPBP family intramembrane metalloprotease [Candidatus Protochlamydia sp.]|nr:CPBP family intramembrane metalloprotease [Candidatus Protochlamydia sp.]